MSALYKSPIEVNGSQLRKLKGPGYVKFYAHWCPHCVNKVDSWESLRKSGKAGKIHAIDCATDDNRSVCKEYDIMAFPTVKRIDASGKYHDATFDEAIKKQSGGGRRKSPKRKSPKRKRKSPKRK